MTVRNGSMLIFFWLIRGLTESGESTHDETRWARARWCEVVVVFGLGAVRWHDGGRATVRSRVGGFAE